MPRKYDDEFKARAARLVTDHAEEYDTRTACITAVAKRLGVSYESLRPCQPGRGQHRPA